MTQIQASDLQEIKFTRDTKVDYGKGNVVINTIFKQYDKDLSGDFNNEEWTAYEQALKKNEARKQEIQDINTGVKQHYSKKLEKLSKEFEKLEKEYSKLDFSAWEKLLAFEKKYHICRNGYINDSEIPSGAMKYDISAFEMGIYDKEKQSFTGECYKKGYLLGLEILSKDEQKEYLRLLKEASMFGRKAIDISKKLENLNKEFDKYKALEDMASSGMICKVGSKDYEEQAYQQYVQIRNESNPFYREIKDLEQKREALRLKGNITPEDAAQIEQYNIQIQQLEEASSQWTVANADNFQKVKGGMGFMLTDLSEQLTYSDSNKKELTNTHSVGAMYSNENFNIMGSFSNAQKYTVKPESEFDNTFNAMLTEEYKRDNISLSSMSSLNTDKNMLNYNQTLGFGYKKVKLEIGENISSMKVNMPNEKGELVETKNTTHTTIAQLSHTVGKFTNTGAIRFSEYGNTYTLSSNANLNKKLGENSSLNISPSISASYSNGATYTLSPNLNCNYSYNNGDFEININANESFSATMQMGAEAKINHNLTTTGTISYKGFLTSLKFNDSNDSSSHSNTYGTSISYRTQKAGTFGLEYSYQNTKNKMDGKNNATNLISFKYSAPLDWSRKKQK